MRCLKQNDIMTHFYPKSEEENAIRQKQDNLCKFRRWEKEYELGQLNN
jgi:hypothetical protein